MIFVRLIDENGMFISDGFVEGLTEFTIETPCPSGFYHPKWNGEEWVEGLTEEEIQAIKDSQAIQEPSDKDRIDMLEDTILFMLMGGM